MSASRQLHSARELALALDCLRAIGEGCPSPLEFGTRGARWLPRLVASEITTLSVCDLDGSSARGQ